MLHTLKTSNIKHTHMSSSEPLSLNMSQGPPFREASYYKYTYISAVLSLPGHPQKIPMTWMACCCPLYLKHLKFIMCPSLAVRMWKRPHKEIIRDLIGSNLNLYHIYMVYFYNVHEYAWSLINNINKTEEI